MSGGKVIPFALGGEVEDETAASPDLAEAVRMAEAIVFASAEPVSASPSTWSGWCDPVRPHAATLTNASVKPKHGAKLERTAPLTAPDCSRPTRCRRRPAGAACSG